MKNNRLHTFGYPRKAFSEDSLKVIFQVDPKRPDRIKKRESKWLEFKKSFNWGSKAQYARTLAAFANTKGGYIVFGVGDKPRILIGLMNDRFDSMDTAVISSFLNDTFSAEIQWDTHLHTFRRNIFGLIFVNEALDKPIISTRSVGNEIKDGEIYYRYHGRTQKIKYPELKLILEKQRERELEFLLKHMKRIGSVGVQNAAVLDSTKGSIVGPGGSVFIDESLLPHMNFLRDGRFNEKEGSPAIKITGEAQILDSENIQAIKKVYIPTIIRTTEIVHAFLKMSQVQNPIEYIKQLCFETSGYLPIYYFIKQAKINISKAKKIISSTNSRFTSKRTLTKRLTSERDLSLRLDTSSRSAIKRKEFRKIVLEKNLDIIKRPDEIKYALQAIRTLHKHEIDQSFIYPLIIEWFDTYYSDSTEKLVGDIRRTICYLDIVYYRNDVLD